MELFEIGIIAIVASLFVETVKKAFGVDSTKSKILIVLVSMLLGTLYILARNAVWWEVVNSILGISTTFYNFIVKYNK